MLMTSDMMILIHNVLLILLLSASGAFAVGAPDYLPDGPHPRIWLTSEEIARLNAKQAASDADVVALISWCDTHLNDAGYDAGDIGWNGQGSFNGYRLSGYNTYLINFALGYQILKDDNPSKATTYATYIRNIIIDGIRNGLKSGEENNGLIALRCGETADRTINTSEGTALSISTATYKLGYSSRNLASVAIAYDWIFSELSAADQTAIEEMLFRWFDWTIGVRSTYNNGVLSSGTRYHEDTAGDCTGSNVCTSYTGPAQKGYKYGNMGHNFAGGHAYLLSTIAVATYGEHTDAAGYLTKYKTLLENNIIPQLSDPLILAGGDSPEGWNYGGGYIYTLPGLYGYYTGTGDQSANFGFSGDLVGAMINRLGPNLLDVPMYGQWTGTPLGVNRLHPTLTFTGIEQRLYPASIWSGLGQYIVENITFSESVDLWVKALWKRSDISPINPNTAQLSSTIGGSELFTTRSSWTNAASTVFGAVRLEGKNYIGDHEGYDEGNIEVMRGADRIISPRNVASGVPNATGYSTIVFNSGNHHILNPSLSSLSIDRYKEGNSYSYVSGEISNAWKRQLQVTRANLFRRSVLHIRPGVFVVYDVTQANPAYSNIKEPYWQFYADPSSSGNVITVTKGASKGFVTELFPAGGSFTETNTDTGYYTVKYTPSVTQEYDQFLHVIEATDSAGSQTTTSLIAGTGGRGAKVGNTVAMFTDSQTGANISTLTYTADAITHYIADLPANSSIAVTKDSVAVSGSPFSSGSAGIIAFSAPGGSGEYQVSVAGAAPSGRRYRYLSISDD